MEFDLRELERAVDAVRARANGTGWAESERKYKEKIEQLEAINRALVQELSGARGAGASTTMDGASTDASSMGTAAASRRPIHQQRLPATASSPSKVLRSDSYKALRCSQTHKLTVVQLDGDSTSGGESGRSTPAQTVGLGVGDGGGGGGAFVARNRHRVSDASIASSSSSPDHARDGEIERLAEEASARLVINDPRESPGGTNDGLGGIQCRGGFEGHRHHSHSMESLDWNDEERRAKSGSGRGGGPGGTLGGNGGGIPGSMGTKATPLLSPLGPNAKVPFKLLMCNDDGCELHEPADRAIRSRQTGMPHSQFSWTSPPKNALVVKKPNDVQTTEMMPRVVDMLARNDVEAWVEPAVHWETGLGKTWAQDDDPRLDGVIDFIVCLGGDGTILWVSNLFPKSVPPVVSFGMGSLGFLTSFSRESIPRVVDDVVKGDFVFTLRSRLVAHVVKADGSEERRRHIVLNEVVIDRGANSTLIDLDVNIDGNPMTKVLADGVMISTPTGSTAYSLAAGGSMVHPGVSGVLFVPICPHTLSFRPLVLPDSVVLTIRVPESARVEPYASFDGKEQRCLKRGESLVVRGWRYPVPSICNSGESVDWFRAVKESLLWNVRGSMQKPY